MRLLSYRSYEDLTHDGINLNSRKSEEYPLLVNCAGLTDINKKFETYNKRGREDYYLMYIVSGRIRVWLDGVGKYASDGDFLIFPPGYKYRYSFSGDGAISYYFVHFTGSEAERFIKRLGFSDAPRIMHAGHSEAAAIGFRDMFEAYAVNGEFRDLSLACALERILISLATAESRSKSEDLLSRSATYIHANYTGEIFVSELAALEGLSVSRYNVLFKKLKGVSPVKYIIGLRMAHAASLLSDTNLGVAEIGEIVGYCDSHFFSKSFKRHFGISPLEYRIKHQEN